MIVLLLKSSLRLIRRQLTLSTVKIFGLALGMGTFIITALFTIHELNFDKQHPDYKNIFRYVHRIQSPDQLQSFAFTSAPTGPALQERYSEVLSYTRVFRNDVSLKVKNGDVGFLEKNLYFADANFLEMFSFPLRNGTAGTLLAEPYALLITPSAAAQYFGNEDPIGKSLLLNGQIELVVKGIFEQDVSASHFDFDFLVSFATLEAIKNHPIVSAQLTATLNLERKGFNAFYTYLKFHSPEQSNELIAKLPAFIEDFRGKGRSEVNKPTLQSLESIHLDSDIQYELSPSGSRRIVYVYVIIGLLVLFAAIVNYVNITTAGFILHMRAVGLKKILGINRGALMLNQTVETAVICMFSVLAGSILAFLFLPGFNSIMQTDIQFLSPETIFILGSVFLATVILSAMFPAFHIMRQQGLAAFQGNSTSGSSIRVRGILVFVQLSVAFILLSVSILIFRQTDFLLSAGKGFDADQLVVVNATGVTPEQRKSLKAELLSNASVEAVTMSSSIPGEPLFTMGIKMPGAGDEEKTIMFYQLFVDEDFLKTFGIPLQEGRFFSEAISADSANSFVVNEAAATAIGDSLLAGQLEIPSILSSTKSQKNSVGVINDFHFNSLHTTIAPLILEYNPNSAENIIVRFRSSQAPQVVRAIESSWKSIAPMLPLTHYFLEDFFARSYGTEQQTKQVVGIISVLVVCLAALGIFGTSLFTLQLRTKEIGVRKLLGSAAVQLFALVFRPTLFLLLGASLIGAPAALAIGNSWLSSYPYHIGFTFALMLAAFSIILFIILSTVIFYLFQIMRIQPATVLRQVR